MRGGWWLVGVSLAVLLGGGVVRAEEEVVLGEGTVEADLGSSREASRTDSEVLYRFLHVLFRNRYLGTVPTYWYLPVSTYLPYLPNLMVIWIRR